MDILTYRESEKPITPEHRLVLAIITRAALDAMIPARKSKLTGKKKLGEYAQSALAFLFGSGLDAYCRWLALDVNYLRKQLLTRNQTTATKQCTITEHHWKCLRENFEVYLEARKRRRRLVTVARTARTRTLIGVWGDVRAEGATQTEIYVSAPFGGVAKRLLF